MKALSRLVLTGMAAAALGMVTTGAYAKDDGCYYEGHGSMMGMGAEKWNKMREQHRAALHDKLKLDAKQEKAWQAYIAKVDALQPMERPTAKEWEGLTAPQRMEKMQEHMRQAQARMADHLAALKEFYAVLTPQQQKTFDESMRGPGKAWHEHGSHGGPRN